jgi:hypothetical protein
MSHYLQPGGRFIKRVADLLLRKDIHSLDWMSVPMMSWQ